MKLAAIYNLWDGEELMPYSLKSIRNVVDVIIVVVSTLDDTLNKCDYSAYRYCQDEKLIDKVILSEPKFYKPSLNQINKRQIGLNEAKKLGCTHFLFVDSDEMYIEKELQDAWMRIQNENIKASVIELYTYFKQPVLRFKNVDKTCQIPFIHSIEFDKIGLNEAKYLPYVVDFGRHTNIKEKPTFLDEIKMHHFSWIRKNIDKKVNSHASIGLIRSNKILIDYQNAKENYFVNHYQDVLIQVPNYFNIEI